MLIEIQAQNNTTQIPSAIACKLAIKSPRQILPLLNTNAIPKLNILQQVYI